MSGRSARANQRGSWVASPSQRRYHELPSRPAIAMPSSARLNGRPPPAAAPRPTSWPWAASHASSSSRSASSPTVRGSTCSMAPLGSASALGWTACSVRMGGGLDGAAAGPAARATDPVAPRRSSDSWSPPPSSSSGPPGLPVVGGSRSISDRNSSSRKRWASARRSYRPVRAASRSSWSGRSVTMRPTWRLMKASARCSSRRSRSLPFTSSRCSYIASSVPNCWRRATAVFSPTPGTPGRLSEVSPFSAL